MRSKSTFLVIIVMLKLNIFSISVTKGTEWSQG